MEDILRQFGDRVRNLRKAKRLTQEELAEKADLHYTYIGGIERGEKNLSLKNIEKIANAFEINIRELFNYQNSETNKAVSSIINAINDLLTDKDSNTLGLIRKLIIDIDEWSKEKTIEAES